MISNKEKLKKEVEILSGELRRIRTILVEISNVLQTLIEELGLEIWFKIEEETGREIIAFRKKRKKKDLK